MSEYIERERLLLEIENDRHLNWTNSEAENQADLDFDCFIETIKAQPIADVAELKHGKWIMRGGWFRCSECDEKARLRDVGGTGGFSHEYEQIKSNYCSHCGAKMDLGL